MKRLLFAATLTLFVGLHWGAQAQSSLTFAVVGNEISPGVIIGNTRYGAAFVGVAKGVQPGYAGFFAASINYSPPAPGAGVVNHIVGGQWAITVFRYGLYRGTVHGTFDPAGTNEVRWNSPVVSPVALLASIFAKLRVTGGSQLFERAGGSGSFQGVLDHSVLYDNNPRTISPKVSGILSLSITRR